MGLAPLVRFDRTRAGYDSTIPQGGAERMAQPGYSYLTGEQV